MSCVPPIAVGDGPRELESSVSDAPMNCKSARREIRARLTGGTFTGAGALTTKTRRHDENGSEG